MSKPNKQQLAHIQILQKASENNKLVIFVGAGVSANSDIPSWNQLIEHLSKDLNLSPDERDNLKIAQIYRDNRGEKEYLDKVRRVLKHRKGIFNELHELIFDLHPAHVLTTNYDDLLEQVIAHNALPYSIIRHDQDFPYAPARNLLVKIHGDLEEGNLVLTEDDYLLYENHRPLTVAFLRSIFTSYVVLFVGYSYSDQDLKQIVLQVKNILGKDFQRAYMLQPGSIDSLQEDFYRNKGVNVIAYDDLKGSISTYLPKRKTTPGKKYYPAEKLTGYGLQVYEMLHLIRLYDGFSEDLRHQTILEQMYESCSRFSELQSLPPYFLTRQFPFEVFGERRSDYDDYGLSLKSNNPELTGFFFEDVQYPENQKPGLSEKFQEYLKERGVKDGKEKFDFVLQMLRNSHIYYIARNSEKDFPGSEEYKKLAHTVEEPCTCLVCEWNRLNFGSVLKKMKEATISATSDIRDDLKLAYVFAMSDEYEQAFHTYEQVANKAWHQQKYLWYFIAKQNQKSIGWRVKFNHALSDKERNRVVRKVESIDLDAVLLQISVEGSPERKLLMHIKEHWIIDSANAEVEKLLFKIRENYEGYKSDGYWSLTASYPWSILVELSKLEHFYSANHILTDGTEKFKNVVDKCIQAFLVSFSTNERYPEKLKSFQPLTFRTAILHGDFNRLKEETSWLRLSQLVFQEKELDEILALCNNFLLSFFEQDAFVSSLNPSLPNPHMQRHLTNHWFRQRMNRYFEKIAFFLSLIEVPAEKGKTLATNLILFLENQDRVHQGELRYISKFLKTNKHLFDLESWKRLLQLIANKSDFAGDIGFLSVVSNTLADEYPQEKIHDEALLNRILQNIQNEGKTYLDWKVIWLWQISDADLARKLKDKILHSLQERFDPELYVLASHEKIIDHSLFFDKYLDFVTGVAQSGRLGIDERDNYLTHEFFQFVKLISELGLPLNDQRLQKLLPKTGFAGFLLNPVKFDYTQFNILWLKGLDHPHFYAWLKKCKPLREWLSSYLKEKPSEEATKFFLECFG